MSIFIQEVLGLLKRNQKKIILDKNKDWFEFGKLYQSSALNTGASYNPKMDPFVIKWGDIVCQVTEDMTRTLPGEGKLGYIPVYTDPSGFCSWDTLKDSIITQNVLNNTINIAGSLVVDNDVTISGCDLTSTCATFNLLSQPSTINFGSGAPVILIGRADPTSKVTMVGTQDSTSCTNGALVVNGGVGIAKNLNVCGNLTVSGTSNLNGDVNLGNAITDIIRLYGILLDNSLNPAGANQVLIGQSDGSAFWTSPPWIISFAVAGDTVGVINITQGNTLSILGGTAINTALSTVDTVTINHDDYGTPGTYAFPSSITTNAQGHITSITAGTEVPYAPKLFTALITQTGTGVGDFPIMNVLYDYTAGATTFTWSRVSAGLYYLTASQPTFFGTKTAYYIIPDVSPGKPYCAAIDRVSDTVLQVNSYDMTGVSDDNCFNKATLKFEIYT